MDRRLSTTNGSTSKEVLRYSYVSHPHTNDLIRASQKNLVDPTFLEKNDVYRQLDAMPFVPSPPSICVAPVSSAAFITECGSTPIFIDDASLCLSIPLCPTSSTDVTLTEHTVAYVEVKRGVVDARRDLVALLEGGEMAAVETGAVREWWNFPGWGKKAPGPADEPKKIYLATKVSCFALLDKVSTDECRPSILRTTASLSPYPGGDTPFTSLTCSSPRSATR